MLGLPEDNVVAGLDMDEDLSSFFEKTTSGLVQDALAAFKGETAHETTTEGAPTNGVNGTSETSANTEAQARPTARSDYEELEALVAQSTSDYVKNTLNSMSPMSYVPQSTGKPSTITLSKRKTNNSQRMACLHKPLISPTFSRTSPNINTSRSLNPSQRPRHSLPAQETTCPRTSLVRVLCFTTKHDKQPYQNPPLIRGGKVSILPVVLGLRRRRRLLWLAWTWSKDRIGARS